MIEGVSELSSERRIGRLNRLFVEERNTMWSIYAETRIFEMGDRDSISGDCHKYSWQYSVFFAISNFSLDWVAFELGGGGGAFTYNHAQKCYGIRLILPALAVSNCHWVLWRYRYTSIACETIGSSGQRICISSERFPRKLCYQNGILFERIFPLYMIEMW